MYSVLFVKKDLMVLPLVLKVFIMLWLEDVVCVEVSVGLLGNGPVALGLKCISWRQVVLAEHRLVGLGVIRLGSQC